MCPKEREDAPSPTHIRGCSLPGGPRRGGHGPGDGVGHAHQGRLPVCTVREGRYRAHSAASARAAYERDARRRRDRTRREGERLLPVRSGRHPDPAHTRRSRVGGTWEGARACAGHRPCPGHEIRGPHRLAQPRPHVLRRRGCLLDRSRLRAGIRLAHIFSADLPGLLRLHSPVERAQVLRSRIQHAESLPSGSRRFADAPSGIGHERPRRAGRSPMGGGDRPAVHRHAGAVGHERRHGLPADRREGAVDRGVQHPVPGVLAVVQLLRIPGQAAFRDSRLWRDSDAQLGVDVLAAGGGRARASNSRRSRTGRSTNTYAALRWRRRRGGTRCSCASTGR